MLEISYVILHTAIPPKKELSAPTCRPVATASTLCQSQVRFSEITPTFTNNAISTACLQRLFIIIVTVVPKNLQVNPVVNKASSYVWTRKNESYNKHTVHTFRFQEEENRLKKKCHSSTVLKTSKRPQRQVCCSS